MREDTYGQNGRALIAVALFALSLPLAVQSQDALLDLARLARHPVWTYFLQGANMWAKDTGQTVKTSFHNGDVPPAGGDPNRHRRQATRSSPTTPIPAALSMSSRKPRGGHSGHQFQHAGPESDFTALRPAATFSSSGGVGPYLVDHKREVR